MEETKLVRIREYWVDNVKVFACILVVWGHFFQSMTKSNILLSTDVYKWFIQTIYYFHVPLFFICSGYLYQKFSKVTTFNNWLKNFSKKVITLVLPYFIFSIITWLLKVVFSGSVNSEVGKLTDALFLNPLSPYWFLYCLFFIFLITPTFQRSQIILVGLCASFGLKVISILGIGTNVYAIDIVLANEIWFVMGMCLAMFDLGNILKNFKSYIIGIFLSVLFVGASIIIYIYKFNEIIGISFILGLVGCFATIFIIGYFSNKNGFNKICGCLTKYTMPIFLMHTIFAAALRSVLFKIGISNAFIHVCLGIIISFVGPIITAQILWMFKKQLRILR